MGSKRRNSTRNDFSEAFLYSFNLSELDCRSDYLFTEMKYKKPIHGKMLRDGKEIEKNFTDECELRYIPNNFSEHKFPKALP